MQLTAALACWFLLAQRGSAVEAASSSSITAGIVEVDLVFPRNESYTPAPLIPIVFAARNAELLPLLSSQLTFEIWPYESTEDSTGGSLNLRWANFSGKGVYYAYSGSSFRFDTEGTWMLVWSLDWLGCYDDAGASSGGVGVQSNSTQGFVVFSTWNSSQEADLVAATENRTCRASEGMALNVTDGLQAPPTLGWEGGETCLVVAPSTVTPHPCDVTINAAEASSISSSITARACLGTDPPISCPIPTDDESGAALRFSVSGWPCLAAACAWLLLGLLG